MKPRPTPQGRPEALIDLTAGSFRGTSVSPGASRGAFVVTTTVLDAAALAAAVADSAAGCIPATCRIGLLGLGNVGSAFARHAREAASPSRRARLRARRRHRPRPQHVASARRRGLRHDHHQRSRRLLRRAGRRHRRSARRRRAGVFAGAPRARSRHPGRDREQVAHRGATATSWRSSPAAAPRRSASRRAASPASRSSARSSGGRSPRARPA